MPTSASLDVQKAILARLKADATLIGLVEGGAAAITAVVPEGSNLSRYVLYGESFELPDRTMETGIAGTGNDEMITLHAYDDDTDNVGWFPVKSIASRVKDLLDGYTLTIAGRVLVKIDHEITNYFQDETWRRAAMDFRVITEDQ